MASKEENKETMICYLGTFNYSIEKLKKKSYQEISTIFLNHSPPKGLIDQEPQLDSEVEEAWKIIKRNYTEAIRIISSHEIDGEIIVFPTLYQSFIAVKQAFITQQTKIEETDKALKEYFELEDKILTGKVSDNCKYEDLERYKELEKKLRG